MKQVISTDKAPGAIGPYSQGIDTGSLVFFSGQIPLSPSSGELVGQNMSEQAQQVMSNIEGVLSAVGLGFENVIKTLVFITDMSDFAALNEVYTKYFKAPFPARSCVAVKALPKGALLEIEIIAIR